MRISRKRPKSKKIIQKRYRVNEQITAYELRLIDENGQNLGIVKREEALTIARQKELDLVEVFPLAQPPVAKILDYRKFKYQEEKDLKKQKARYKIIEIKGIRLSLRISEHDKEIRLKQAEKFLQQGNKIRIEMILKGREYQHRDLAKQIINEFINSLNQQLKTEIEQPLTIQGRKLLIIISKK